jgi:Tat protein translocase TatC
MPDENDTVEKTRMTLGEHLEELRRRIIYALLGLAVGMGAALIFGNRIIGALKYSYVQAVRGRGFVADKIILAASADYAPAGQGPPQSPRRNGAFEARPAGVVAIEAEHHHALTDQPGRRWAEARSPSGASGEGGMKTLVDSGALERGEYVSSSPRLDYRVRFERPGRWYVWVRGNANGSTNTEPCHVGLDGASPPSSGRMAFDLSPRWKWSRETGGGSLAAIEVPSAGVHTVNLWVRETAADEELAVPAVASGFTTYFGVALIAGLVLASPWVFGQLWMFISAGLYKRERRYVYYAVPASAILFAGGALFFLFVVSVPLMRFFIAFNAWMGVKRVIMLKDHIHFVTRLMLVFGLAFQTPIVVFLLAKMGLVSLKTLNRYRRHVVIGSLILAAMLTSPSPIDQIALALPMWILYEAGVLLAYLFAFRKEREEKTS